MDFLLLRPWPWSAAGFQFKVPRDVIIPTIYSNDRVYNKLDRLSHSGNNIPGAGVGVQEDRDHQQGRHHPGWNMYASIISKEIYKLTI